ncbi:MAG: tetratricopeptide repeat protein [Bryobacteraceae bacterium]
MTRSLLLFAAVAAAQTITPELRRHVEAGLKAKQAGNLDAAIVEFRRVVELAPELAAAHVNLGAVYFEKRAWVDAVPSLRRALELNPDLPGARQMLGTSLLAQGAAAEALPLLEAAGVNDLAGIALLDLGRPRDAVDRLEAALTARPDDPDLLYYLALAHSQLSQRTFERLRANPAAGARVEQMLGEASAASGDREGAGKHFAAALAARPDLRGVHYALGELHFGVGDYARAEAEFRAETKLAPASAAAAFKLGVTLANLGRSKDALAELNRAYGLAPDMPETSFELGKLLASSGDLAGAATALERVTAVEGDSKLAEGALLQLSQVYRKAGRTDEADAALKRLRDLRSKRR